jgi:hypothetical protein
MLIKVLPFGRAVIFDKGATSPHTAINKKPVTWGYGLGKICPCCASLASPFFLQKDLARKMGSLSYEPRGNLSLNTDPYYSPNIGIINEIQAIREVIPRVICPKCPAFFVWKLLVDMGLFAPCSYL